MVDAWGPFALTAFISLSYAALLSLGIHGTADIYSETETWLKLPDDNVLPHILALHIAAHAAPKPFVGAWLSSDRPPLQAGFDLLLAALTPFVKDGDSRYQAIAIVLQVTIFGALFTLCRLVGLSKLRSVGVVLLCWMSGFFFLNSIFVWPKLLAAAYGAFGLAFLIAPDPRRPTRAVLAGASTGLGLLSHGGVVFTLPVLVISWLLRDRKAAPRPVLTALLTIVAVTAPWTWYQKVYDPPGDRLLKWHLAGHRDVSSETFPALLIRAYTRVDPATIVANKMENLRTIMPMNISIPLQKREFFHLRYGLSALLIPYLAALLFFRTRRPALRWASAFAWIALSSNLFWCLAMFGPATTVIHQGSYLTVALMFLAGGIVATEWIPVYTIVLLAQTAIFVAAWLPKYDLGAPATPGRVCDIVVVVALATLALRMLWRPVTTRLRNMRLQNQLADDERRFSIRNHKEVLIFGIVALIVFALTFIAHTSLALLIVE